MRLYVEAEDTQQRPATTKPAMELSAVPVAMFGSQWCYQYNAAYYCGNSGYTGMYVDILVYSI